MSVPILVLRDALTDRLATVTGKTWEVKYAPIFEPEDLPEMKYLIGIGGDDLTKIHHGMAAGDLRILLGFQQALPVVADRQDEYVENLTWLDERMSLVHDVKKLFYPGGQLRDETIGSAFEFRSMKQPLAYNVEVLLGNGIFQTAVELTFVTEYE